MRIFLIGITALILAGCASLSSLADPTSDAPEPRVWRGDPAPPASSYAQALKLWRGTADVNAWIGARFEYDLPRAMRLSETQREKNGRLPILDPQAFFAKPRGVCVDLTRFAVETLRVVEPGVSPAYLMIEFDPVAIAGNTLRRHWVASFRKDGKSYFFADSKRPGHIAGPYESTQAFITDYARYRGRPVVAFREVASYERRLRKLATSANNGVER